MNDKKEQLKAFWGVVELMGHLKLAGELSEEVIFGTTMLRIDVPQTETTAKFTRYFSSNAIYSVIPTSKEIAIMKANEWQEKPVYLYSHTAIREHNLELEANNEEEEDDLSF